jgi:hypothetical protein
VGFGYRPPQVFRPAYPLATQKNAASKKAA